MIEIVINYDQEQQVYKVYEPTSDTLLVTATLSESMIKLSEFLQNSGMIDCDILSCDNISYHIDSFTFKGIVESNFGLLKRLNNAPSGFMSSSQRFGISSPQSSSNSGGIASLPSTQKKSSTGWGGKKKGSNFGVSFGKSSFLSSNKKFWNKKDY